MYRYRDNASGTEASLRAMKHLPKLGRITKIRGYRYHGKDGVSQIAVMVHGENGTVRFRGFSWGYSGQGCRGLQTLFNHLGVPSEKSLIVMALAWPEFHGPAHEFWSIDLNQEYVPVCNLTFFLWRRTAA